MLKLYRQDNKRNSRRALEAIDICLIRIHGYLTEREYDYKFFLDTENQELARGLGMSFDPFVNEDIYVVLSRQIDISSAGDKKKYFDIPFKCLYRILESIEFWIKQRGSNGYFDFIEETEGFNVEYGDTKMNFIIQIGSEIKRSMDIDDYQ